MDFLFLLFNVFIFILGLCIGSFLNCIIYRLEKKESLKGRSFCPYCKHKLSWKDLVPIFSFLSLGGRCRYCKKVISWQYPLVELFSGMLFLLIFNLVIFNFIEIFFFYIAGCLIIIFVYDLKHYLIPDKVLLPATLITFLYRFFESINWDLFGIWRLGFESFTFFLSYIFSAIIAAGFFLAIFLASNGRWIGFGDVKLTVLMGLLLGFPNILLALFLAFFFGAVIGLILMFFGKKNLKSEIPFGPFLITGTFIALFFGKTIISWYLNLFI